MDTSNRVTKQVQSFHEPLATFSSQREILSVLRRSLRLHQWAKNALLFVPLVLGGKVADSDAWVTALFGFIALGLVASATYVINRFGGPTE